MHNLSFTICLVVAGAVGVGSVSQMPQTTTDPLRQIFLRRVDEYVSLHRRLEGPLPPEIVTSDPVALFAPKQALGREIRRARRNARQGEIFSPAVARYFRDAIAEALRKGGVDNMLAIVEDENTVTVIPKVNGDYPAGASISVMPPCLLAALPPLPRELEYRFLGRDLILWDTHAGLIVDFVPFALPQMTNL